MKNWIQSTFLLFVLAVFVSSLHAKIGPVNPGQALWCVDQRIGSNVDIISSKLATINFTFFDNFLSSKIDSIIRNSQDTVSILNKAMSELDAAAGCLTTPIYTPTTISASGVYCLNNNIVGPIVIQASDVVVNLNNHLVTGNVSVASNQSRIIIRNGTIDNNNAQGTALSAAAGAFDITVQNVVTKNALIGIGFTQVSDGLIEGCTLTQNTTGLQFTRARKIVVEDSTADGNRSAGFDLIASTTCTLSDCTALGTGQGNTTVRNNTVIGFSSSQGNGNIFERCIANSTQALSTTDYNSIIAGFALRNAETCSKIIGCEASNATASPSGLTVPYGILLEAQMNGLQQVVALNPGGGVSSDTVNAVAWSPDGVYLAVGGAITGGGEQDLYIYRFDRVTQALQQVVAVNPGGGATDVVRALAWSPDGQYLAVGGTLYGGAGEDLYIYRFDTITQGLQQIVATTPAGPSSGNGIYSLDWTSDGQYLAVGTDIDTDNFDLFVYQFDRVTQTLQQIVSLNPDGIYNFSQVRSVDWSPDDKYLAVGGNLAASSPDVKVYVFDSVAKTLGLVASASPGDYAFAFVTSVSWSPDGQYLAVGGSLGSYPGPEEDLYVYKFDRPTRTLQQITSVNPGGGGTGELVYSVDWSPDGQYLAISGFLFGVAPNRGPLFVYRFDRGSGVLQQVAVVNIGGGSVYESAYSVQWSPDGVYLAVGTQTYGHIESVYIYQALTFPSNNVIKDNTVYCNSAGRYPSGIGISGSSIANLIIQNTAYCNPICQAPNQPLVQSNYAFVCNVFNSLFGQAPTDLQNISISCCQTLPNPIDVALIMKQTLYNETIVQSELEVVQSLLDSVATGGVSCNPTPITTSPTTLTGPGIYCIASNSIAGLITIDGNDVVLDLSNRTITGGIDVAVNRRRVTIENGVVSRTGSNAINVNPGCSDITIKNVTAKNSLTGMKLDSVTGGLIEGCTLTQNTTGVQLNLAHNITIQDSKADANLNAGFDLIRSTTCCLSDCKALGTGQGNTTVRNNTVIGFSSSQGNGNIFERCIANSTQALSTTDYNSIIAGFALRNAETCSKIIGCEASNATASPSGLTVPYGILLDAQFNGLQQVVALNPGGGGSSDFAYAVAWSPDGVYLAVGGTLTGGGEQDLYIYRFDRIARTLQQVTALSPAGQTSDSVRALEWSPDGQYLAVGRAGVAGLDNDLYIYKFDTITQTLQQIIATKPTGASSNHGIYSLSWTFDGLYLAISGDFDSTDLDVVVYAFNPVNQTLQQVAAVNPDGIYAFSQVWALEWSPDGTYLAIGGNLAAGSPDLVIYLFDRTSNTMQRVVSLAPGGYVFAGVYGVSWSPDGQYLAVSGSLGQYPTPEEDLYIYKFDRPTGTLQQITSVNPAGGGTGELVYSVDWSPDGQYVAIGGFIFGVYPNRGTLLVYRFDRGSSTMQQVALVNIGGGGAYESVYSVKWSPDGVYLAVGTQTYPGHIESVYIYQALTFPSNNVIKDNTVYCNSAGRYPSGVGISGSSIANMIIQNTAYNNPIQQAPNQPIVRSNYYFATNVFNSLFQQAPTLLQNISVECCAPNCLQQDLGLILQQAYYKLSLAQNNINAISSFIDYPVILGPCDATPVTTSPTTLTGPGIYCIGSNSISGLITISGNDIMLDLNERVITGGINVASGSSKITIKNGVVSQAGNNAITVNPGCTFVTVHGVTTKNSLVGIKFDSVTNGLIEGCTLTQNTTGVQLNVSHNIIVQETNAHGNLNAGFDLTASTTCLITDCKAIATGQGNATIINNSVLGFVSRAGYGNIFERCIANSTQALSTSDSNSTVAGFALRGLETGSKIIECESANATTSPNGVTIPYGILLEAQFSGLVSVTSLNPAGGSPLDVIRAVGWSPDGIYLAIGGDVVSSGSDLIIYQFDYLKGALTQVASLNPGGGSIIDVVYVTAWSPDGQYIAVGGSIQGSPNNNAFRIYRFDRNNFVLTQVQSINPDGGSTADTVQTIAWSPDARYLALGGTIVGDTGNRVIVYKFDAVAQTAQQVTGVNPGGATISVEELAWSPDGIYLAVGGLVTGNDLYVYRFNRSTQTLTQVNSQNPGGGGVVRTLDWSFDGKYLAVAGSLSTNDLLVYRFNATTQTLTQIISVAVGGGADTVYRVRWSPDAKYLALCGDITGNDLYMYQFDAGAVTLTQIDSVNPDSGSTTDFPLSMAWSPDGQYLAVGGDISGNTSSDLFIYRALRFASNNLVQNNVVYCNAGSSTPSGVGISGSSVANMIIQNTVYANPIDVFMTGSNYLFVTNVFNQLFGQGPSLLQNISLDYRQPISQPTDLGLLLDQIFYQNTITCGQTTLSRLSISGGTISITASGAYCMAEDITADMVISATAASIDMNNRILYGTITLQTTKDVSVFDGRVEPIAPTTSGQASTAAITISANSLRTQLLRLNIICADTTTNSINGRLGVQVLGDDALISNCTIKSGTGAANSGGAGGAGGTGILLSAGADRALVEKCVVRTGNGGNGTTQGGNGGDGIVVSDNVTQAKIIGCVVLQVGRPGSPLGASSPQGGNGIVINSAATKTLVTQCIIRNSTVGVGTVSAGGLAVDNRAVSTNRSVVYENVVYNIGNDVKYSNFASSILDEFGVQLDQPPSNGPLNKVANVFFDPLL